MVVGSVFSCSEEEMHLKIIKTVSLQLLYVISHTKFGRGDGKGSGSEG